jgi:hypothetical protein
MRQTLSWGLFPKGMGNIAYILFYYFLKKQKA